MNKDLIFDAMEYIDDNMLEKVNALRSVRSAKSKRIWMRYASAAACVCMILGGLLFVSRFYNMKSYSEINGVDGMMTEVSDDFSGSGDTSGTLGVTIPKTEVSLKAEQTADMLAFLIYEDRMYVQYEWIYDHPELVGEYVGTSTGLIDKWTKKTAM